MKRIPFLLAISCFIVLSSLSENTGDKKTVSVDVSSSRITVTGKKPGEVKTGSMKLVSGNLNLEENQLKGGSFKFPAADFVITDISRLPAKRNEEMKATHRIEGNLTMKGVTRKVSFDASVNMLKGKVALSSQPFTVNAETFGNSQDLQIQMEIISK